MATAIRRAVLRFLVASAGLALSARTASATDSGATCWWYHDACSYTGGGYTGCPWTEEGQWALRTVMQIACSGQN